MSANGNKIILYRRSFSPSGHQPTSLGADAGFADDLAPFGVFGTNAAGEFFHGTPTNFLTAFRDAVARFLIPASNIQHGVDVLREVDWQAARAE